MVREIEMYDPTIGKLVKKNEMGVPKVEKVGIVGKLVKRIQMKNPTVGKVWKLVRFWSREVQEARAVCDAGRNW